MISRILFLLMFSSAFVKAQEVTQKVNVFLGTSGDHGQMSPAASYPFGLLSIGPQTYPNLHAGYEFKAKKFLGFTHTRMEGVGCMGSGGNFLLKPILNSDPETELIKEYDKGEPGYYEVQFTNGIKAQATVDDGFGKYQFSFPQNAKAGFQLNLDFASVKRFIKADYRIQGNKITGCADTKSTCDQGSYRIYFCFRFPEKTKILELTANKLMIETDGNTVGIDVGLSSVNEQYAEKKLYTRNFDSLRLKTSQKWEELLGRIQVKGSEENENLFYSLLYRTLQSPFKISESDGAYRATDGSLQKSQTTMYHGWAVWDNYRDQLPLLSMVYPDTYQDIIYSLTDMYRFKKAQWTSENAPSPSVRTEHTVGVLLDALNKGYKVPLENLLDKIKDDVDSWKPASPDKELEAHYDYWAASELFRKYKRNDLYHIYRDKALGYKKIWTTNFKDVTAPDVDKMGARGIYQGTVWQYRWLVPQDMAGLNALVGSDAEFIKELDTFFDGDFYNHANETDTHVPSLYNATSQPWKSQKIIRQLLTEDVIQFYFNDNSKGIDPYIGKIYKNQPDAYLRTMDDDAGAMSAWWVLRSLGFSVANVGDPIFYLNAPIFSEYSIYGNNGKRLTVCSNPQGNPYIKSVNRDGKESQLNWMKFQDLQKLKTLKFNLSDKPSTKFGTEDQFITGIK